LVYERAPEPDSAQVHLLIPKELFEEVYCIHLGLNDPENLTYGLTPFLVCPRGYYKASVKREKANFYSTVHEDRFRASLKDIREPLTPDINLPGTLHQLAEFIGVYSILIDVLIGKDTPLAVVVHEHYHYWRPIASEVMAGSRP
jgi:hypothetical protein